jgi:hypothetical protein
MAPVFLKHLPNPFGRIFGTSRRAAANGRLTAIFLAESAGAPMQPCNAVEAVIGIGLEGDRYATGRGFWRLTDGCQVTLIHAEDLIRAERRSGLPLSAGQHRRNLVIDGWSGIDLRGCRIGIGEAQFSWHRVRPPCGYLDRVAGRGYAKALGRHGGHCLRVLCGGVIKVGDPVRLLALE